VSFFARFPGAVAWAGAAFGAVIVQVALGIFAHSVPALGMLHGVVALVLLVVALVAARKASAVPPATDVETSTGAHAAQV
jgi:heme A synthase